MICAPLVSVAASDKLLTCVSAQSGTLYVADRTNGKVIYSATALNTSKTTEGGNEFLTQDLPFAQFLELTRARKAKLKLGDREYPLTEKQLASLRDMASYAAPAEP